MKKYIIIIAIAGLAVSSMAADVTIPVNITFRDSEITLDDGSVTNNLDISKSWLDEHFPEQAGSNYIARFTEEAGRILSNKVSDSIGIFWRKKMDDKAKKDGAKVNPLK